MDYYRKKLKDLINFDSNIKKDILDIKKLQEDNYNDLNGKINDQKYALQLIKENIKNIKHLNNKIDDIKD